MEPVWRGKDDTDPGLIPVGVAGGDCRWLPSRDLSSSDSLRPRTLSFDLDRRSVDMFIVQGGTLQNFNKVVHSDL